MRKRIERERAMPKFNAEIISAIYKEICSETCGYIISAKHQDLPMPCDYVKGKYCKDFWGKYFDKEGKEKAMEEKKEEQALVKHANPQVMTLPMSIAEIEYHSQNLHKAGLLPQGVNVAQAAAIIQTGREIGLQPMESIRSIYIVRGRISFSVQLQLALARSRGGVKIASQEVSDKRAVVTLERNGETTTAEFTMDEAHKAGLTKEGGSYSKYGSQMLFWRACGIALRRIAPDCVMGMYSPEEMESVESQERKEEIKNAVTNFTNNPSSTPAFTPASEVTPAPTSKMLSEKQAGFIVTLKGRLKIADDIFENGLMQVYGVKAIKELNSDQAKKLIERMIKRAEERKTKKAKDPEERDRDEQEELQLDETT